MTDITPFTEDAIKLASEIDMEIVKHFEVFIPKAIIPHIETALKAAYDRGSRDFIKQHSAKPVKEDEFMKRPTGSNADEWNLFLENHQGSNGFIAVQIAEALDAVEARYMSAVKGRADFRNALRQERTASAPKDIEGGGGEGKKGEILIALLDLRQSGLWCEERVKYWLDKADKLFPDRPQAEA